MSTFDQAYAAAKKWEEMTPEERDQAVDRVARFMAAKNKVDALSDIELVEQVIERIGSKLNFGSEEDNLLDGLLSRYEDKVGIKRDDEGRIVKDA